MAIKCQLALNNLDVSFRQNIAKHSAFSLTPCLKSIINCEVYPLIDSWWIDCLVSVSDHQSFVSVRQWHTRWGCDWGTLLEEDQTAWVPFRPPQLIHNSLQQGLPLSLYPFSICLLWSYSPYLPHASFLCLLVKTLVSLHLKKPATVCLNF